MKDVIVRKATGDDVNDIKALCDDEKEAFGFITKGTIEEAVKNSQIMVVCVSRRVVGFQHYYHRKKDLQTTFYHKVVNKDYRRLGLATKLVNEVVKEARRLGRQKIVLKCPVNLPSNKFHKKYGFSLAGEEKGKSRPLNIWQLDLM